MTDLSNKLRRKLDERLKTNNLRRLEESELNIDFSSNDYLGLANSKTLFLETHTYLTNHNYFQNGSTGSRLLTGNHKLFGVLESTLSKIHQSESATIYNSGFDANIGFFSSVPQRNDLIFYDEYIHASIRDGVRLSNAKAFSFKHNDLVDLEKKIKRLSLGQDIYIVTESVFSMDGDSPDLVKLSEIALKNNAKLIVDEAHSLGINKYGLVQELNLESKVFARIITFGKALGCHGAVILGSNDLKLFLVNFSKSLIYTTSLPPHSLASILIAYQYLESDRINQLKENIIIFKKQCDILNLTNHFIKSDSAIQCFLINDIEKAKEIVSVLKKDNYSVKAVLSPTVKKGKEIIRICIHSFNTKEEIKHLLSVLKRNN